LLKKPRFTFKKALAVIAVVTVVVSGGAALGVLYYTHIHETQLADPAFALRYLNQKGELPSHYIEEILDLCVDKTLNIHEFNTAKARKKLQGHPLIKSAEVKKQMPDSCLVVYQLYEPVALVSDWDNAAIDRDGRIIPFHPFYPPEGLPIVTIGEVEHPKWGEKLRLSRVHLALKMLRTLPLQDLENLDVSRVDLPSFGQREIIVTLTDGILRLNPDDWKEAWGHFLKMRSLLDSRSKPVVDLRIPNIALLQEQ